MLYSSQLFSTERPALQARHSLVKNPGVEVAKPTCSLKLNLIEELSRRTQLIADVCTRISHLIGKNESLSQSEKDALLASFQMEMNGCIKGWEFAEQRLEEHKKEHGC